MEVDGSDVKPSRVAKKRDRTEVESTFGAEDDMNNEDVDPALSRHRKRRQRKSAHIFRGQKRGRDLDSPGVDTDYGNPRGKGRAFRRRSTTSDSDLSAEVAQTSKDPLCKGRHIGEEWEAHGVQFRVGPDGQRLRKVLIKEDRLKFNMVSFICVQGRICLIWCQPVDSEHPDRSASVTAIVERWYNEDEYMAAKEAHELAWQDSDKSSAEPEMPHDRIVRVKIALIIIFFLTAGRELHRMLASNFSGPRLPTLAVPFAKFASLATLLQSQVLA